MSPPARSRMSALRSITASSSSISEDSEGTYTDSMKDDSRSEHGPTQQDLARFWQALHDRRINRRSAFAALERRLRGGRFGDGGEPDQKTAENGGNLRQKRHS